MFLSRKSCSSCGLEVEPTINVCPRDGTTIDDPFQNDPIFQEKYEFLESIGAGGMGVIYKARHLILNNIIAIKMVHSHLVSPQAIQRFQVEGQAASSLSHPYIIKVHDFGTTKSGQPYMVMDYLTGHSLSQVLAREGHLDTKRFLKIFLQASDALAHAHARGIVHRDIKPANIMLVPNAHGQEEVRIMDFGLAKIVDDSEYAARHLTKTGVAMGSPYYMSPEQAKGSKVDHRSDLYSLGCTMYECLTGSPPFEGKTPFETMLMHLNDAPASLKEASLGTEFDPRLQKIIDQLLEKSLDYRYQSMDELHADLLILQRNEALPAKPDTSRDGKVKIALLCAAIVGALGFAATSASRYLSAHQANTPLAQETTPPATQRPANETDLTQLQKPESNVTGQKQQTSVAAVKTNQPDDDTSLRPPIDIGVGTTVAQYVADKVERQIRRREYKLDLNRANFIGPISDADLAPVSGSFSVGELILTNEPIHDQGLEYLKKVPLRKLDLESTNVVTLRPLRNNTDLLNLNVSKTPVNTQGVEIIGQLPNLRELYLTGTNIKDTDLCSLYPLHNLKTLDLTSCPNLSSAAVDKLKGQLPKDCKISYLQSSGNKGNDLLYDEGVAELNKGDPYKAVTAFSKASMALKNSPNQGLYADCLSKLADCKMVISDLPMACTYYGSAIDVMKKVEPDSEDLGIVYTSFSFAKEKLEDLKSATSLREAADQVFKRAKANPENKIALKRQQSSNLLLLSQLFALQQDPQQAIKTMAKGLAVAKSAQLNQAELEAACTERIAQSLSKEKKYPGALDYYVRSLSYWRSSPSINAPSKKFALRRQIKETYLAMGRTADAAKISLERD